MSVEAVPVYDVSEHEWEEWRPGTLSRMWASEILGTKEVRTGEQIHQPGVGAPNHWHPYEEHLLFVEGKVEVYWEGQTVEAEAPCVAVFPAKTIHGFTNIGDGPLHLFAAVGSPIHKTYYVDQPDLVTKEYESASGGVRHDSAIDERDASPE